MNKTALALAAAITFDLGVLVVAGQAATAPAPASGACLKVKLTDCMVSSIATGAPVKGGQSGQTPTESLSLNFTKISVDYTPQACLANGGKLATQKGVQGCLLPGKDGAGSISNQAPVGNLSSYKH